MPELPPSPPPSAPVAGAGSNWIVSGGATSGTPSALDYAYYTQTAEWDYARKPSYYNNWKNASYGINLSQVSAIQSMTNSRLHVNAKIRSTCKKIQQQPGGGSYTQMQKFSIYTVATDQYGFSYGTVPDPSAGVVFGPRGKVFTTQPWIWQLPWDATRDVEYDVVTIGTSDGLSTSAGNYPLWRVGNDLGTDYEKYAGSTQRPDWSDSWEDSKVYPYAIDTFQIGGGAYNLSSEIGFASSSLGLQRMEQFIEANCAGLNQSDFRYRYVVPFPQSSDGFTEPQAADRAGQNLYYSTSRHEY